MQPRGTGVLVISVTTTQCFVAILFVCFRGWVRVRLLNGFRYDDYLLWTATVFLIAITGETIGAVYHGLGRHTVDLEKEDYIHVAPFIFAYPVLLTFSLFVSKAVVVTFLLMVVVKTTYKIILWVSIGTLGILSILEFLGLFLQCFPVKANWNPLLEKQCHFDVTMVGYFLTGYGAFLDFFLAALPWFFFSSLQLKRKDKLVVCISLSTGIFAGICGIIRLIELYKLQSNPDRVCPMIWTNTETCVSIICVCLPVIRTFYCRYRKGVATSTDSTRVTTGHQSSQHDYRLRDGPQNRSTIHTEI